MSRRSKSDLTRDERLRRLRLGDLRKVIGDRCRHNDGILPDDDAGIDYLRELLRPISIGPYEAANTHGRVRIWGPNDRMRKEIERWANRGNRGSMKKARGYVTALNGKPLTMWLTTFQLGDCRKLFRYRAGLRGAKPTTTEIDDAHALFRNGR